MIEKILICSFITFACWYTMQQGEIFSFVGDLFAKLPAPLHNPTFDCVICMGFWYGSISYWIIWHQSVKEWLIVGICVVGLNTILSKLFPPQHIDVTNNY